MGRRIIAGLLASTLLVGAARPARADGPFESPFGAVNGDASSAKKVTMFSLLGATVATFGVSFVFLAQANSADSERRDFITAHGGNPDGGGSSGGCRTADECAKIASLKQDAFDASSRWRATMFVGGGLLLTSALVSFLWPNVPHERSARVVPAGSQTGGGLQLEGSF